MPNPSTERNLQQNIRLKRIYDRPSGQDGFRVLATRYWPRGVSRDAVDEYQSRIAPSRELIKEYRKGGLSWTAFGKRYKQELSSERPQVELRRLARIASSRVITLLCYCDMETDCHRTLLREAIIDSVNMRR
jgi:uncharacterized protein YeaO (DUF488 family)